MNEPRSPVSLVSLLQQNQSIRSNRSAISEKIFKHNHLTYRTCFSCLHVKTATIVIGFAAMTLVFLLLFYSIFVSMEEEKVLNKAYLIPTVAVVITLLYLLVGIIQHRPSFLYPFITLQIALLFITAISAAMLAIAVGCHTEIILQVFVNVKNQSRNVYERRAMMMSSSLLALLFVQLGCLRSVCSCFRYFNDLNAFKARQMESLFS